ncbi:hypothetical protein ONZ51_g3790 [Trametes cubensis]|uniref:LanC-like protein 2 n=1 Tax=Trametes cubensis TaxID=1111947 RepID=A0AAD7TXK0_9APHY|nr:hypothetical protein ONZ51_g3790 [Trametes cubensis]
MSTTFAPARYIPHADAPPTDLKAVRHRIQDALIENVDRVHRHPSSHPKVYVGSAGEIIMDMRAFAAVPSHPFPNTPTSSLIVVPFHEPRHGNHVSYLETSIGPATLVIVRQLRLRQNPDSNAHKHARRGRLDSEVLEELELQETWRAAVDLINGAIETATAEELDEDGCEVLYGRAGLLYALILLRSELLITTNYLSHAGKPADRVVRDVEALCSDENIQALVDDIIKRGELGARRYQEELEESEWPRAPPLMWKWHGSRYLGAAHGVAGILHELLHAPSKIIAPHWQKIISTVEWLLTIQDPLGNWPSKASRHMPSISGGAATNQESKRLGVDEEHDDALVQWCHGATGFLIFFSALLRRAAQSPETCPLSPTLRETIVATMKRAGELVYTRGFLRKGVGLCHGVGGSVYALLAVSEVLDSPLPTHTTPASHPHSLSHSLSLHHKDTSATVDAHELLQHKPWLMRAVHLADLATGYQAMTQKGQMAVPERPYSLYEGVAGMCCAWAEVLMRLPSGVNGSGNGSGANGNGEKWQGRGGMPGFDDITLLE